MAFIAIATAIGAVWHWVIARHQQDNFTPHARVPFVVDESGGCGATSIVSELFAGPLVRTSTLPTPGSPTPGPECIEPMTWSTHRVHRRVSPLLKGAPLLRVRWTVETSNARLTVAIAMERST